LEPRVSENKSKFSIFQQFEDKQVQLAGNGNSADFFERIWSNKLNKKQIGGGRIFKNFERVRTAQISRPDNTARGGFMLSLGYIR